MKETQITNNWIDRYSDNDLSESERQLFQMNLMRNSLLRKELLIDVRLNKFMEDPETIELMQKIVHITRKPYLTHYKDTRIMVAASVFCLIIFGASYLLMRKDPADSIRADEKSRYQQNQKFVGPGDPILQFREINTFPSSPSMTKNNLAMRPVVNDRYKPLAEYEYLVGAVTRSSWIVVCSPSPEIITQLNFSVPFEWDGAMASDTVNLVIINNQGTAIHSSRHPGKNQKYMLETEKLGKGLFYWKVLVNEEIVMVGRMIIE